MNTTYNITQVIWAETKFFGIQQNQILESTDGVNWSANHTAENTVVSIIYAKGFLVAVPQQGSLSYSTDEGDSWESVSVFSGLNSNIIFDGEYFILSDYTYNYLAYSTNMSSWDSIYQPRSNAFVTFCYSQGFYCALDTSGSFVYTQNFLSDWQAYDFMAYSGAFWSPLVATHGIFISAAMVLQSSPSVYFRKDKAGLAEARMLIPAKERWTPFVANDIFFFIFGRSILMSRDGENWEIMLKELIDRNRNFNCIAYGNGMYIITSTSGGYVAKSIVEA